MKKIVLLSLSLFLISISLWATVTKSTERKDTNVPGLECSVENVKASSSEWMQDEAVWSFRTTNGYSAKIKVTDSTLQNCKVVYSSAYAPRSGEWGTSKLTFRQIDKDQGWSYSFSYSIEWK